MQYDIFIQGGQSNSEGTGHGPVTRELSVMDDVWYLEAEKTVEVLEDNMRIAYADKPLQLIPAQERVVNGEVTGDFSLTFAEEYIKAGMLEEDRRVLIVRAAIGGTGFSRKEWGVGYILSNKLVELVNYALSLNEDNRVVGVLWHQGEHDSVEKNPPEKFKAELTEQFQLFRSLYGNMPIVAGDFVNDWKSKNLPLCEPIIATIKEVLAEIGNSAFVETADLPSNDQATGNGDDIHFCRNSLHRLGRRYFDAFSKL